MAWRRRFLFGMVNGRRSTEEEMNRRGGGDIDEVVETTGLGIKYLKEAARDKVGW